MFENANGRLEYAGNRADYLWPGDMRPGLWMSAISRMGLLLRSCLNTLAEEAAAADGGSGASGGSGAGATAGSASSSEVASGGRQQQRQRILDCIPPVLNNCSVLLKDDDVRQSRDLYFRVACQLGGREHHDEAAALLREAIRLNPYAAEPRVLLAQIHMQRQQWDAAAWQANEALRLFCEWGTAWDKRMAWEAWVAWTRVILQNAQQRTWPDKPFGMLNLGLVAGLDQSF